MRSLVLLLAVGCGGTSEPVTPRRPVIADAATIPEMAVIDAAPVAPPLKRQVVVPVDVQRLPAWPVPARNAGRGPRTTIYAVDMGSRLLAAITDDPIVMRSVTKRITGRVDAPDRDTALAVVAAQLGVELASPNLEGKGATVDLDFQGAPTADILRVIADTGRLNIVAPGPLPAIDIRTRRKPWDGVLMAIAKAIDRTVVKVGNTYYLLPAGTTLPPLPKAPATLVDIDVKDGTIAHATVALRQLASVPDAACDGQPFTLRLRRIPVAEALRAMALTGGGTIATGATCPSNELDASIPVADLRLVAIAAVGIKRAAVFDHKGAIVSAVRDGTIVKDIGPGYVTFAGDTSVELHSFLPTPRDPIRALRRTAALIKIGDRWTAFVDTDENWFMRIDPGSVQPPIEKATVELDGVHLTIDGKPSLVPFGGYEMR